MALTPDQPPAPPVLHSLPSGTTPASWRRHFVKPLLSVAVSVLHSCAFGTSGPLSAKIPPTTASTSTTAPPTASSAVRFDFFGGGVAVTVLGKLNCCGAAVGYALLTENDVFTE